MTRPVRSLWRLLAALLLLATVPAAAILPPPAPPRPEPVELGADVLDRLDQVAGDVSALALVVCEVHPAEPPPADRVAPALARWGPKPHVGAFELTGGQQHLAIQWFSCEIAVALSYDADGVRVRSETVPAGGGGGGGAVEVTEYLVDTSGPLSQVVVEGTDAVSVGAYYVRGDDLLAVLRPDGGGGGGGAMVARFYHADGLGSVRALTDEAGVVTDRWDFSAFGELLAHVGDDPQAYLFAGEALDPNVGWYYNRARWMDPRVGRFASVDPWGQDPQAPQALHRYLYCSGSPVEATDPTGKYTLTQVATGLQIAGTIYSVAAPLYGAVIDLAAGASLAEVTYNLLLEAAIGAVASLAIGGLLRFASAVIKLRPRGWRFPLRGRPSGSIWSQGIGPRGEAVEQLILGRGRNLPWNYPVIDDFTDGVATSIKSLDLTGPTSGTSSYIRAAVTDAAKKLSQFVPRKWGAANLAGQPVNGRVLVFAFERGAADRTQANLLRQLAEEVGRDYPGVRLVYQWLD